MGAFIAGHNVGYVECGDAVVKQMEYLASLGREASKKVARAKNMTLLAWLSTLSVALLWTFSA